MLFKWLFTVFSLMSSCRAISLFRRPRATPSTICCAHPRAPDGLLRRRFGAGGSTHETGAADRRRGRSGPSEQGNRAAARHQREDGEEPLEQHLSETGARGAICPGGVRPAPDPTKDLGPFLTPSSARGWMSSRNTSQ